MKNVNESNEIELIIEIEGGNVKVNNEKELETVKELCKKLMYSQGFYERLLRDLEGIKKENLPIIL